MHPKLSSKWYIDTLYIINVSTTKISLKLIITKSQSQPHLKRMNTRNIYNSISFTKKVSHYTILTLKYKSCTCNSNVTFSTALKLQITDNFIWTCELLKSDLKVTTGICASANLIKLMSTIYYPYHALME